MGNLNKKNKTESIGNEIAKEIVKSAIKLTHPQVTRIGGCAVSGIKKAIADSLLEASK